MTQNVQTDLSKCMLVVLVAGLTSMLMCVSSIAQDQHAHAKKKPSSKSPNSEAVVIAAEEGMAESEAGPDLAPESNLEPEPKPVLRTEIGADQIVPSFEFEPSMDRSDWLNHVEVGYDDGFVIGSQQAIDLDNENDPFSMRVNGWGQLRIADFESNTTIRDQRQIQLQRGRLVLSGSAFTNDFAYFLQLDGRSSSGDDIRLLDYFLWYDLGHHSWGMDEGTIGFKIGKYKMPFNLSRYLTAREFEFTDRSVASTFFDVNRSLAWGLAGRIQPRGIPINWEAAVFNGLVTGGAETGSSGDLDNNFALSARMFMYPTGEWGTDELADFDHHCTLATRIGWGFASTTNNRIGKTEFESLRVVDSGGLLSDILPETARQYDVSLYAIDASMKYRGWSSTMEYYFRSVSDIQGTNVPDLFDHGFWFQIAKFVIPGKLQATGRWSRVVGDSGNLGGLNKSSDEVACGFTYYFRGQNAKLTIDATNINGAPIDSSALDLSPGDNGWLVRTQIQFAF